MWWRVVALDTGFIAARTPTAAIQQLGLKRDSTRLPAACVSWLEQVVFADPRRRRRYCSRTTSRFRPFERDIYPQIVPPLARTSIGFALWFWGHEHRFALYAKHQDIGSLLHRSRRLPRELPSPGARARSPRRAVRRSRRTHARRPSRKSA